MPTFSDVYEAACWFVLGFAWATAEPSADLRRFTKAAARGLRKEWFSPMEGWDLLAFAKTLGFRSGVAGDKDVGEQHVGCLPSLAHLKWKRSPNLDQPAT